MADISYGINLRVDKDFLSNSINVSNVTATMAQTGMQSMTLVLSSTPTAISTSGLSSVGVGFFRNLSSSTLSTAAVGIAAGGSFVGMATLRAGEPAIFRLTSGTTYQVVGTAGARLRVDITEG